MMDQQLTNELAVHVMGWKPTPDRFVKSGRNWIPRWRFRPLTELADAFDLLDRAADRYSITCERAAFKVEVHAGSHQGHASGDHLARAISVAVARAHALEVDA